MESEVINNAMTNRDIGLLVYRAEMEKILREVARIFADRDALRDCITPLPATEIGGGFAFPDNDRFVCRRIYACGAILASCPDPFTREEIAKCRSEEAEDEWW
jgi:hypothetical protein